MELEFITPGQGRMYKQRAKIDKAFSIYLTGNAKNNTEAVVFCFSHDFAKGLFRHFHRADIRYAKDFLHTPIIEILPNMDGKYAVQLPEGNVGCARFSVSKPMLPGIVEYIEQHKWLTGNIPATDTRSVVGGWMRFTLSDVTAKQNTGV